MLNRHRPHRMLALAGFLLAFVSSGAMAAWETNMRRGVTDISGEIFSLHMVIFYITCVIGVLVFGTMIWAMIKFRKSKGVKPATWHENTKVEIVWTTIPLLILISISIPATITLAKIYDDPEADVTIRVDGHQWRWEYTHLAADGDTQLSYFSNLATPQFQIDNLSEKNSLYLHEVDQPLVIPVDTPVKFLITSQDVIHSWWVPDFGIKKDAIPGIVNEAWTVVNEPGTYRGMCTELCGVRHAYMPVVVKAVPQAEYEAWLAEQGGADVSAVTETRTVDVAAARQ